MLNIKSILYKDSIEYMGKTSFHNLTYATDDEHYSQGIYFLYYKDTIVYIGKSISSMAERIRRHESRKRFKFDTIQIHGTRLLSISDINVLELYFIAKYKPIYNKDSNDGSDLSIHIDIPKAVEDYSIIFSYMSYKIREELNKERGYEVPSVPVFIHPRSNINNW
jgi:hypothetical protein